MSSKRLVALGLGIAIVLGGCVKRTEVSGDPKQRLNDYISRSFSVRNSGDRKDLLGFLTGKARTRLAGWSDEQFQQAFVETKRQFVKLAWKEVKSVAPDKV